MSKFHYLVKSGKKLSKSENLLSFGATKAGHKFLTFDAKIAFNCLWLTFIKALIFWHFNSEYHIEIKTNTLCYAISEMLSQLIS